MVNEVDMFDVAYDLPWVPEVFSRVQRDHERRSGEAVQK